MHEVPVHVNATMEEVGQAAPESFQSSRNMPRKQGMC